MIPVLPLNCINILDACIPYFCGLTSTIYQKLEGDALKKCVRVQLDFGSVSERIKHPENIQPATRVLKQASVRSISPTSPHPHSMPMFILALEEFYTEFSHLIQPEPRSTWDPTDPSNKHGFLLLRARVIRLFAKLLRESVHCFRKKTAGKDTFDSSLFVVRTCNSLVKHCPEGRENSKDIMRFVRDFADSQHFADWVSTVSLYLLDREKFLETKELHPRKKLLRQQQVCLFDDLLGAYGHSAAEVQLTDETPQLSTLVAGAPFSLHYLDATNMSEIKAMLGYNTSMGDYYRSYANINFKSVDLLPEYILYRGVHSLNMECRPQQSGVGQQSHLHESFTKSRYYECFLQSSSANTGHALRHDSWSNTFNMRKSVQPSCVYDLKLMCHIEIAERLSSFLREHPIPSSTSESEVESSNSSSEGLEEEPPMDEQTEVEREAVLLNSLI